jgi:sugar phosphate isomerase/epimerase
MEFITGGTAAKPLIQNLKKIKNHYKGKVNFTIENLPPKTGPYNHFPQPLKDLAYLKKLLSWLNFTLDIGHAFQSGENLNEISKFLKKYKDSVLDIHLHDATLKGKAHLALGKGELDVNAFFKLLNKIGYAGYISLETLTKEDTRKSWKKIYKK